MKDFIRAILMSALYGLAVHAEETEEVPPPEYSWVQEGSVATAWTSIETGDSDYSLKGYYGGFGVDELQMVYITSTVGDGPIRDGHYVLTWVEIDNPDGAPGAIEAFTCKMQYKRNQVEFDHSTVSVTTYDGLNIDFSRVQGANDEWYAD